MCIRRLLVLLFLFLVALGVVPLVAQSATKSSSASSQPESLQFVAPRLSASDRIDAGQFQTSALIDKLDQLDDFSASGAERRDEDDLNLSARRRSHGLRSPVLAENDSTCYFIRSYRVTRDDPNSEATRPAGYSTCLSVSGVPMKNAVESH
jgi:hypothetical protein